MTRHLLSRLRPRAIAGQVVLLVACSVVLFHLAMTAAMQLSTSDGRQRRFRSDLDRFVDLVRVLDQIPRADRAPVAEAVARAHPRLGVSLRERTEPAADASGSEPAEVEQLRRQLEPEFAVISGAAADAPRSGRLAVAVALHDGEVLTGILPQRERSGPPASAIILGTIVFMIINLALLLWWALRGLTAPLARFAHAAESFSLSRDAPLLPESKGPEEVRLASRALNRMQARIRTMVENRTRMVAAVSHDLRTPITRLRLRAEFIEDEDTRRQMLRDLDQMSEMVHGALSFLRDGEGVRSRALVDLASLLQTVCDEWADAGDAVSYEGPDRLAGHVHATELRRAVENLVENAIKHGRTRVTVRLRASAPQEVEIDVIDEGPGIPGERKRAMLEPFTRGDDARSMNEASPGFGLGLAIARSAAEAHGGDLVLRDGSPCGLIATLRIGIAPDPDRVPDDPEPLTRRGSGS